MKRTMVYLEDEMHEGLRMLAFEHKTSIAELIRRAVDRAYGETLEDIRDMEVEMAEYARDPSSAMPLDEFLAGLKLRVPGRDKTARATRA
jgi:hypothetical protein